MNYGLRQPATISFTDYISAWATVAAVVAALAIAIVGWWRENSRRAREDAEQAVTVIPLWDNEKQEAAVFNYGTLPITDVRIVEVEIVDRPGRGYHVDEEIEGGERRPAFVVPGQSDHRWKVHFFDLAMGDGWALGKDNFRVLVTAAYTDARGRRWTRKGINTPKRAA